MDSIIEEMGRRVLDWRHKAGHGLHQSDIERWARHLRDVVQPQLDELEALKAERAAVVKPSAKPAREVVNAVSPSIDPVTRRARTA